MSSDEKKIDDFFRQKSREFSAPTGSENAHWQQMQERLSHVEPDPPKKSWKKITRRTITYMGVAAVVITTTYYAAERSASSKKTQTTSMLPAQPKVKNVPDTASRFKAKPKPSASAANYSRVTPKKSNVSQPVSTVSQSSRAWKTVRQVSDTIFQLPQIVPAKTEAVAGYSDATAMLKKIRQPQQEFTIHSQRDTLLFGRNGTTIHIPAMVFANAKKQVDIGPVIISLVECYSYADMIAYDLSTTSGGLPLVTGGMIYLAARNLQGEILHLLNYRTLKVAMPFEQYDPEMQLFNDRKSWSTQSVGNMERDTIALDPLDGRTVNWQPSGQLQGFVSDRVFQFPNSVKLLDVQQQMKTRTNNKEPVFTVKVNANITDEKIIRLISAKYNLAATGVKIQRTDSLRKGTAARNTNVLITGDGFLSTDSVMIPYVTAVKSGYMSREDSLAFMEKLRMDSLAFEQQRRQDSIRFVRQKEFDKTYQFDVSGLGWINCDRFYNSNKPLMEFSLNPGEEIHGNFFKYLLIFQNQKSIVPGFYREGSINFGKIPEGEPVQLICVTTKEEKTLACVESFVTAPGMQANFRLEEMTAEEFKARIAKL